MHYVKMENGEPRGQPMLKDVMLADAQVIICVLSLSLKTSITMGGMLTNTPIIARFLCEWKEHSAHIRASSICTRPQPQVVHFVHSQ